MTELLSAQFMARLERVQLSTRRRLSGRTIGDHRSRRFGSSLDFADYRDYHPGDDYRRIDYPLYARTGQLFIRLFEAEDDLPIRLLVDTSGSMGFHGKLDQAARVAAAMGFVALTQRDAVTLHTFPASRPARRFVGKGGIPALMSHLGGLQAAGNSDVAGAAADLLLRADLPGVTIVVSDLLTPTWEAAIDRLPGRGGEIVVIHVIAREELAPDLLGDLDLEDAETGEFVPVSLSSDAKRKYGAHVDEWLERVAGRCHHRAMAYSRLLADADLESELFGAWRAEGILR